MGYRRCARGLSLYDIDFEFLPVQTLVSQKILIIILDKDRKKYFIGFATYKHSITFDTLVRRQLHDSSARYLLVEVKSEI